MGLNLVGAKMLGKNREQLINRKFGFFVLSEARPEFSLFLEALFSADSSETPEVILPLQGDRPRFLHLTGILAANEKEGRITVVDITDRTLAIQAMERSESKYRNVFITCRDSLFLIDRERLDILDVNEAACILYGYSREEMLKLKNNELSAEPAKTEPATREFIDRMDSRYHKKKNGTVFPVNISLSHFTLDDRQVILASIRDITEQKQAARIIQEKSEQLEKVNAEKDKFFSIMAHDLRGPFNSLLGFTRMLAEEMEELTKEEIKQITGSMNNSAINMYGLLENLLEWSRLQRGLTIINPESFLMLPVMTRILKPVETSAFQKGIGIDIAIADHLKVFADSNIFGSIVRNLSFNAVKFSNQGGSISISAKPAGSRVEISVSDTGIGMSADMIGKLFRLDGEINRKGTGGEPSTGLGLILCKDLIEKSGGTIRVESEVCKGSVFTFTLPSTEPLQES
jgi:PAS domain S-box-containing protein